MLTLEAWTTKFKRSRYETCQAHRGGCSCYIYFSVLLRIFFFLCTLIMQTTYIVVLMQESVELPLTHPEYYEEMGIKPPKGVILYGAPGTGQSKHLTE